MRREMNTDEIKRIDELYNLIRTETPKDYEKLIDEAITNDSLHVSTLMLSALGMYIRGLILNSKGYCGLEVNYFRDIWSYVDEKSDEIYRIRDEEFLKR